MVEERGGKEESRRRGEGEEEEKGTRKSLADSGRKGGFHTGLGNNLVGLAG